jgi:hypothetical protein
MSRSVVSSACFAEALSERSVFEATRKRDEARKESAERSTQMCHTRGALLRARALGCRVTLEFAVLDPRDKPKDDMECRAEQMSPLALCRESRGLVCPRMT